MCYLSVSPFVFVGTDYGTWNSGTTGGSCLCFPTSIMAEETAKEFLTENGFTLAESAYMGDDLIDAPLLRAVALPAAPAQAEETIKNICTFVAKRDGGAGAIRDFANMILEARDVDPFILPTQ